MQSPNLLFTLHNKEALLRIDTAFYTFLQDVKFPGWASYKNIREGKQPVKDTKFLLDLAPFLEDFISYYFNFDVETSDSLGGVEAWIRKHFIQKRVAHKLASIKLPPGNAPRLWLEQEIHGHLSSANVALYIKELLADEAAQQEKIEKALVFCAWALKTPEGKAFTEGWPLFFLPQKVDYLNLLSTTKVAGGGVSAPGPGVSPRVGFDLTDEGADVERALTQAHYCLYCHERQKDSCSTGKLDPKTKTVERNPLAVPLEGCPLGQKISEMNLLAAQGHFIAAVAMAMVDNPMLLATGHRICQDCSKACIFQKQTPVDIPAIETFLITNLLKKPWGFELYTLLSLWNPLNIERPLPKDPTGKHVLIVGLGPAGFTLAYHLLMEGHRVTAIDGMKIEPLPAPLDKNPGMPIKYIYDYFKALSQRPPQGFGGVMEFGITARWNKNFLLPLRLLLERWEGRFIMQDSVRFGSTLTAAQAFDRGYDHIALCIGAGKPRLPRVPGALTKGGKLASDFLMALQTNGVTQWETRLPLTVDLPCVVIGGGLTAVDAATEALAYYPLQVQKVRQSYQALKTSMGEKALTVFLEQKLSRAEQKRLKLWLDHGAQIQEETKRAREEGRPPNYLPLLNNWGGVHILYRQALQASPAYGLNHPELQEALNQGVIFWENTHVLEVGAQKDGQVSHVRVTSQQKKQALWPVKSVIWALGIEDFMGQEKLASLSLSMVEPSAWPTSKDEFIVHTNDQGFSISCFGDIHPAYQGSVVKAMASAKNGYKTINKSLSKVQHAGPRPHGAKAQSNFKATVYENKELSPGFHELIIHAPQAAQNFQPGQLYRLQPYGLLERSAGNPAMVGEGVALSAVKVSKGLGRLHFICWTTGGSSWLLNRLPQGAPVSLMGPTGCGTQIRHGARVLLAAGQLGLAIGKAMRAQGAHVTYIASFHGPAHPLTPDDFFAAGDTLITCSPTQNPSFFEGAPNVLCVKGMTLDGLEAYEGHLEKYGPLTSFDRVLVIGSTNFLQNFYTNYYKKKRHLFRPNCHWEMAVTTPMQCMMQGVCGQCIQRHTDGTLIFSCARQDQPMDTLDMPFMQGRLASNRIQEVLYAQWMKCLGT